MATGWTATAEKRSLEGDQPVAVGSCAFRKKHDDLVAGQPPGDFARLLAGLARVFALDKNRPLQFRERSEYRPAGHVCLGDKGDIGHCAERNDIAPGYMISCDQERSVLHHLAMNMNLEPEKASGNSMPPSRKPLAQIRFHDNRHQLYRQQHDRDQRDHHHSEYYPRRSDHVSGFQQLIGNHSA
jgi:hypothetical protein